MKLSNIISLFTLTVPFFQFGNSSQNKNVISAINLLVDKILSRFSVTVDFLYPEKNQEIQDTAEDLLKKVSTNPKIALGLSEFSNLRTGFYRKRCTIIFVSTQKTVTEIFSRFDKESFLF